MTYQGDRFDDLARRLASRRVGRRTLLRFAAGSAAAGALGLSVSEPAYAASEPSCIPNCVPSSLAPCLVGITAKAVSCALACETAATIVTAAACAYCLGGGVALSPLYCVKLAMSQCCSCASGSSCTGSLLPLTCCDSSSEDCTYAGCRPKCYTCQSRNPITLSCVNECPNSWTCCPDGGCYDTQTDRKNCGSCGNVCNKDSLCCSGTCVDVVNNNQNCGQCDSPCASPSFCCDRQCCIGTACTGGVCS